MQVIDISKKIVKDPTPELLQLYYIVHSEYIIYIYSSTYPYLISYVTESITKSLGIIDFI